MPIRALEPLRVAMLVVIASAAAADGAVDGTRVAVTSLSCRQVVATAGALPHTAVRWYEHESPRSRPTLDAWCRGVGPVVYQSQPTTHGTDSSAALSPIAIVSWNVNVGAGNLSEFVTDLRAGEFSDGRPVEHFVLLLQEALRTGDTVPPRGPWQAGARRLFRRPPRVDIVRFADELGLSLFYAPSMRNGLDANAPAEDRGNAILSTLPLLSPGALELPFERQRRIAVLATLGEVADREPLAVASAHLDPFVGASRLWVFGAAGARGRQARALAAALPPHGPAVIGGDFNTWLGTSEPALREMTRVSGQRAQVGEGTYATGAVLDYLFFRTPATWRATYDRTADTYGSDHYPLVGWVSPASAAPNAAEVTK